MVENDAYDIHLLINFNVLVKYIKIANIQVALYSIQRQNAPLTDQNSPVSVHLRVHTAIGSTTNKN